MTLCNEHTIKTTYGRHVNQSTMETLTYPLNAGLFKIYGKANGISVYLTKVSRGQNFSFLNDNLKRCNTLTAQLLAVIDIYLQLVL